MRKTRAAGAYFYPGCHRMEPYRSDFPHAGLLLPITEQLAQRVLILPTGTAVHAQDISQISQDPLRRGARGRDRRPPGRRSQERRMSVKVSVLTTTYNHEPYIGQTMDSVLAQQTDFPWSRLSARTAPPTGRRPSWRAINVATPIEIKPICGSATSAGARTSSRRFGSARASTSPSWRGRLLDRSPQAATAGRFPGRSPRLFGSFPRRGGARRIWCAGSKDGAGRSRTLYP